MITTCSIYGVFTELVKKERKREKHEFIRKHQH